MNEYVAVGESACVDAWRIDYVKVIFPACMGRVGEQALSEFLHVRLPGFVGVDESLVTELLVHFLTGSLPRQGVHGDCEQDEYEQFTHIDSARGIP